MSSGAPGEPLWCERGGQRSVDVLGIGEISFDHVAAVDGLPRFAGKLPALDYATRAGGQVASALHACARLGLRTTLVSSVGDDEPGDAALEPLRAAGVDVAGVRRVAGARTQTAWILVDRATGERAVIFYRDPRLALDPAALRRGTIERARALHLDATDPELALCAANVAREVEIPVVLDADGYRPELDPILCRVDFPIVSREFAETYSQGGPRETLARLCAEGARLAVVTLGAIGALARSGERQFESPGFRVDVRDTTGAGDAFHGAFVWALLEGLDAERSLRVANAAGALCCGAPGAQGGHPTRAELDAFLRAHEPVAWSGP